MKTYDEDEHVKTVYAHFGLAFYFAQVLEHGIVNMLVFVDLLPKRAGKPIPRKQWIKELDLFLNSHFQMTLGKMIRSFKEVMDVPEDLEILLSTALKKRNFLAHDYFRERATEFMSYQGREKMIEELDKNKLFFEQADTRLNEIIEPLRKRSGITDEHLQKALDELRLKANGNFPEINIKDLIK
ncbi:MAG: hypothetical protein ABIF87_14725 [Pseudomonadota bacterium]